MTRETRENVASPALKVAKDPWVPLDILVYQDAVDPTVPRDKTGCQGYRGRMGARASKGRRARWVGRELLDRRALLASCSVQTL